RASQEARPDRIALERRLQCLDFSFRNGHGGIGEGRQNSECEPYSIPGSCVHGKSIVGPRRLSLNPGNSLTPMRGMRLTRPIATVGKWRQRFIQHRLAGLYDELLPGRPRTIEDEQIAALLKRTLSRKPTS